MSLRASSTILRKEIREALRDRNLVVQLVIIPLFLYPLLGFGAFQIFQVSQGAAERKATVLLVDRDVPDPVRARLQVTESLVLVDTPDSLDTRDGSPRFRAASDLRALSDEEGRPASAMLSWWRDPSAAEDSARIQFDRSRERSSRARDRAREAVIAHQDSLVTERAAAVGLVDSDLRPWVLRTEDTSSSTERGRWLISLILPIFLMIMLPQGTYYAVLDTIVGERERGTFETIVTSPLTRSEIFTGKFLYAVLWSMVAFLLNLVGMLIFVRFVLGLLGAGDQLSVVIAPLPLLVALVAVLLLAGSLAAIMMVVAAPAQSYREGQAALSPVYMVSAFAGMFVVTAGDEFTVQQALMPIINVTALLKSALRGELPTVPVLVTFAVLGALVLLALGFAARLSSREALLFDSQLTLKRLLRAGGRDRD